MVSGEGCFCRTQVSKKKKKRQKDKKTVRAVSADVLASCAERCTQELSAVLKAFLFFTVVGARNTDPPLLVIVR